MKKLLATTVLILLAAIFISLPVYANEIAVTIDGQRVNFEGQPPVIISGSTLVPVRGVFEALGFEVGWNSALRQATLTRVDATIIITIDSMIFTTNGVSHALDVPAQTIGGSTMVPLRAVLESVGYALNWDGATSTVLISTDGTVPVVVTPRPWSNETTWSGRDVIVRVDGVVADIPFHSSTSQLSLSIAPVLNALNLPENYVQFIQSGTGEYVLSAGNPARILSGVSFSSHPHSLRQHIMAELLNIDIVFDMYYRTIDITSNSQSGGLSRVLPVQFIPRYGWVRMTNEMLRDVERMIGETVVSQIAEEGITVVFCPYLSAGNRRFVYEEVNRPYLSIFTHTHRAATGSNYLARNFFGSLYRPGIISQQGSHGFRGSLSTDLFYQAENGGLAPDWTRTSAFRYLDSARAETQALLANPLHTDPYRFLGIGRHFCERTGNFYNGNFQVGFFPWRTITRQGVVVEHYRTYRFFEDGYEVRYRDWHGNRVEDRRFHIGHDNVRYQTNCPFLNGFETMELQMLDSAFGGVYDWESYEVWREQRDVLAGQIAVLVRQFQHGIDRAEIPPPARGHVMRGTIIGDEYGWNNNPASNRYAAWDGNPSSYFDPLRGQDSNHFTGMRMREEYILTEIRILPRHNSLHRFYGASIWGFNGNTFAPDTATLIWESSLPAVEHAFFVIPASEFVEGSNTGFTNFVYFNRRTHGDVAEIELWGFPR